MDLLISFVASCTETLAGERVTRCSVEAGALECAILTVRLRWAKLFTAATGIARQTAAAAGGWAAAVAGKGTDRKQDTVKRTMWIQEWKSVCTYIG